MNMDLGPIYEPDSVGFTFETWGWYLVGIAILLVAIFLFFRWLKLYRENHYRRAALKRMTRIEEDYQNQTAVNPLLETLACLKLVAMERYGRQTVAQLHGDSWIEFLELKGKNTPFTHYKEHIEEVLYTSAVVNLKDTSVLMELSKKWISTHA